MGTRSSLSLLLGFATLTLIGFLFGPIAVIHAGEREEFEAIQESIADLRSNDGEAWQEGLDRLASVPKESSYRSLANHCTALLLVRSGVYPKAWKALAEKTEKGNDSTTLQFSRESLALWLLLEAESKPLAEAQFKKVVLLAMSSDLKDSERMEAFEYLGAIIGMLESTTNPVVSKEIIQKGIQGLERNSKPIVTAMQAGRQEAKQWCEDLQGRVDAWSQLSREDLEKEFVAIKQRLQDAESELGTSQSDLKSNATDKKQTDEERKKWAKQVRFLEAEGRRETPGRPKQPIQPRRPREPNIIYERPDPKTGERRIDRSATDRERREYNREMDAYDRKEREYREDLRTFANRMQEWEQKDKARRAQLQADHRAAEHEVQIRAQALQQLNANLKDESQELQELRKKLQPLERDLAIATFAYNKICDPKLANRELIRPSHLELIHFSNEASLLERNLKR